MGDRISSDVVGKLEGGGWMFGGGEMMVKVGGRMMNLVVESDSRG